MPVTFSLEGRQNKKGDFPIRLSITMFGHRFQTVTGFSISTNKWNKDKQQVLQGCSNARGITYSTINSRLKAIDKHFTDFENDNHKNRELISNDILKKEYHDVFGGTKVDIEEKSFFDYLELFCKEEAKDKDWTKSTIMKFKVVQNHLKEFNGELSFDSFNHKGLSAYRNFLLLKKNMRNTTIEKHLKFLKWFLRWAVNKGYSTNTDFMTYLPKKDKKRSFDKRVIFLDFDELMSVYNFQMPEGKNYLERVRDVFCFCCFTGLRHSDVYNLKRTDIKSDSIQFDSIKTGDKLTIELNKFSHSILEKYKDIPFKNNKALPVISNQKMNDYLKELGELCQINQPTTEVYYKGNKRIEETVPKYRLIGTHTGRRTFICNALTLGIPAHIIMKWTGHSDYKAMKPYIDIADKMKAQSMNLFNQL